jgi:hypothetical protein
MGSEHDMLLLEIYNIKDPMLFEAITEAVESSVVLENIAKNSNDLKLLRKISHLFIWEIWKRKCMPKKFIMEAIDKTKRDHDLEFIFDECEDIDILNLILTKDLGYRQVESIRAKILSGKMNSFLDALNTNNQDILKAIFITKEAIGGKALGYHPDALEDMKELCKNEKVPEKVLQVMIETTGEGYMKKILPNICRRKNLSLEMSMQILEKRFWGDIGEESDERYPTDLLHNTKHREVLEYVLKLRECRPPKVGNSLITSIMCYNKTLKSEYPDLFIRALDYTYSNAKEVDKQNIYLPNPIVRDWFEDLHPTARRELYSRLDENTKKVAFPLLSKEEQAIVSIR